VAGNVALGGVAGVVNVLNLLQGATDPDGATEVKDAVLTGWPVELGPQPTPASGTISFTPAAIGNYTVNYQVVDATGLVSDNIGAATLTVIGAETITIAAAEYRADKRRWTVTGTDTVRAGQKLTIAYANGTLKTGEVCDGTATIAACVVNASVAVDGLGAWTYDAAIAANSAQDPRGTQWLTTATRPTQVRVFSSAPALGGARNAGILFR
jgi:hypothetical protein